MDAHNDRLALERVDLESDPEEEATQLTPNRLRRAKGKAQDQLLSAFKQHVRRQARTAGGTELDIACSFLVKGNPPRVTVAVKRRGHKAR